MRTVGCVVLVTLTTSIGAAQQSTERDAVLKALQVFFDTMTARDVDGARAILVPQGRFQSMRLGNPEPRSLSNEEYLAQLQASKQTMQERIWEPVVQVHGAIASVWAPYDFWIDGKFSHCGVEAFDFIRTKDGWKVAGGVYTVEEACAPSPLGPPKPHK